MATPLGLHAPRLERVRTLLTKRGRSDEGRFAVEGPTMLAEAGAAGLIPEAVYATEKAASDFRAVVAPFDDRLFIVPDRAMARLSDLESPPGLVAVFPAVLHGVDELLAEGEPVAVLAGIADPGNAGTLLRTAEIFGIDRAIFAGDAVEPHNPKTVRATMGAIFRMHIGVVTASALVEAASRYRYRIVAAARDGQSLPTYRFPERALLAIGNERHGVSLVLPQCNETVAIPHAGRGESLNASVAGGIIFYAFSQQSTRRII